MTTTFLPRYADAIRQFSSTTTERESGRPSELLMGSGASGSKRLEVAYAPFDFVNDRARVVIVGLTPGSQQMRLSLEEAGRCLRAGMEMTEVIRRAKAHASFGGSMRNKLVELLDFIGVNRFIDRPTAAGLWSKDQELAHFTSCLRYPVFVDGSNYSGNPRIMQTPFLRAELERWLVEEMRALPDAVWVTLGDHGADAARYAAKIAGLDPDHLVTGLPHPSGANNERVAYFLCQKPKAALSAKTNAVKMDAARERILAQMARLIAERSTAERWSASKA